MTAFYTVASGNLVPYITVTGVAATPVSPVWQDGYTLVAGTYFVPLASSEGPISEALVASVAMRWSSAFAATITLESCNFPSTYNSAGHGAADTTDIDLTVGNWFPESPATADVLLAPTGAAYVAPTLTASGAAVGGALMKVANLVARRYRLKLVVSVGGTFRAGTAMKD